MREQKLDGGKDNKDIDQEMPCPVSDPSGMCRNRIIGRGAHSDNTTTHPLTAPTQIVKVLAVRGNIGRMIGAALAARICAYLDQESLEKELSVRRRGSRAVWDVWLGWRIGE